MFCIIFDALFFSDGLFFFLSDVLFSQSLKLDVTANIDIMMTMMTANIYWAQDTARDSYKPWCIWTQYSPITSRLYYYPHFAEGATEAWRM